VIDVPNSRSSHTRSTPRGGGLAIVAIVVVAALLAAVLHPESFQRLAGAILPAISIAAISWLDDVHTLNNRTRFSVHLLCATVATAFLGPVERVDLGSFGGFDLGLAAWPLTILWIVGLTNAFNFMDGIDGIAGITAAVAGAVIAIAAGLMGSPAVAAVALAFAGSSIGFLSCNWPPARIFMGDVGSAFCGFVIAALPLAVPADRVPRVTAVVAITMWPFIFDTAFTLLRRLSKRENVFESHRSHIYQRLVISGWSHRAASSLFGGLSAMAGAVALSPLLDQSLEHTATTIAAATILVGAALLLTLVVFAERTHPIPS
jgi:UDP-N-acetylmuramyl pentapeptide phosphotransferase/UDP-N-acetylglucosamine-1-phosphate transferase